MYKCIVLQYDIVETTASQGGQGYISLEDGWQHIALMQLRTAIKGDRKMMKERKNKYSMCRGRKKERREEEMQRLDRKYEEKRGKVEIKLKIMNK